MVRNCCVITCSTVWNPYDEKSLFSFPWKNDALMKEWLKIIPTRCKITVNSRICSLHFQNDLVEQKFGKRILKKDAIPTIFANENKTSQEGNVRKILTKDAIPFCSEEKDALKDPLEIIVETKEINDALDIKPKVSEQNPFKSVVDFKDVCSNIELPNNFWSQNFCNELRLAVWTKFVNECNDENSPESDIIQVTLYETLNYTITYNGKEMSFLTQPKLPQNVSDINNILKFTDDLKICKGGPKSTYYTDNMSCADIVNGMWKHNNCYILSDTGKTCNKCFSLFEMFEEHKSRRKKEAPVRFRIKPHSNMKTAIHKQSDSIKKLKRKIEVLQNNLKQKKKKSEETVVLKSEDYNNVSETQIQEH